jgi:DNA-binding CsgD family transcriptional regulator
MSLDERVSTLIKRIYCAGEDANEWDQVADLVLSSVGAHAGLTTLVDLNNCEYNSTQFLGKDDNLVARASEEYQHLYRTDPSLLWATQNPRARFCDSSFTLPTEEYLAHPFVQWNRDRLRATHWYVGYTPPEEQLSYSFSVHFPAEQGAASARSLRLFRMLFDHLDCAMRLTRRPFDAESNRPLLLLDSGGNVQQVSNGAMRILAAPDGLSVHNRRLSAATAAEQATLDTALARAASVVSGGTAAVAVKISRPSGQRQWILTIRPMLSSYGPFGRVKCEMLVQIHDGAPHIGSLHLLQSLFDLTSRELQVVRLLAAGHSVESLAAYMNISSNTARTHLRSIFAKTATSRQSELLQLCASLEGE